MSTYRERDEEKEKVKVKERNHFAEFFLFFLVWKESSNGICYIAGHSTVPTYFF